jgi:RNA polymerase sigma factor (sigma-70 family)
MDERSLIDGAQEGDLSAFNQLVLNYQSIAFNVAYRIMGDQDSAADATQDAFISAFRNIKRFRGGSFRSWILRIVTNACYDELRKRKRRPASSLEALSEFADVAEPDLPDPMGSVEISPESEAERGELIQAIQDCIHNLPKEFRTVVILIDVQGFNYQEVSDVIDRPLGTVKSRLARARLKLRDCLGQVRELLPASYRLKDEVI